MAISSHPDVATLMTCSAGSTPEALCAVVTSHLSMCPQCLDELRSMEKIGVALFEELKPVNIDNTERRIGTAATEEAAAGRTSKSIGGDVPSPLVEVIGNNLDALEWQPLADGIEHFSIPIMPKAKGDLRLLKLEPGKKLPEHRHAGEELVLVLRGSYHDGTSAHNTGDFADLDDDSKHAMIAEREGCILLIGNEAMPAFISQLG